MINTSLISNVVLILINILGTYLALWVYLANRGRKVNLGLSLMIITILSWITFYHLASLSTQHDLSLILFKISGASVFVFFIAYYFFIVRWFLGKKGRYKFLGRLVLLYGFVFALFTIFTDFIIVTPQFEKWGAFPIFSIFGRLVFYGYVIFLTALIIATLLIDYFKSSKQRKLEIQYFLIGVLIFTGLNVIFNVILQVLFQNYRFYQLGNYSVIFLIGFTTLAIIKQGLFGIKVVLTSLLVGLIAILLLLDILFLTPEFLHQLFKGLLLVIFLYFGYSLIKSVLDEIKRRQELEGLTLQLEKANIELKKLDKAKSEFLSIASHQLRTPLTAIKGYLSMLIEGTYGKISDGIEKPVKNIYISVERMNALINNLLNVSKIRAGKIEMNYEKVCIDDIISEVIQELGIKAAEKELNIKWEKPKPPLPAILIDKDKIRQVILNIIDNAIKYTKEGWVAIKSEFKDEKCKIQVSDTGQGITKEELGDLFKSFSRGRTGYLANTEGAGLGLYIARKFVELHGGKVWAESPGKGKGSTFFIELPIR